MRPAEDEAIALKKIVFADQCLGSGGAERVMCTVIRSLDPKKYEIHLVLVTEAGALKFLIPEYVVIHVLGISNTRKALFPFIRLMQSIQPDIVYSTLARTVILALAARFFCPRYMVIARYNMMPAKDIQEKYLHGWRLLLVKKLYRSADAVIAQTEEMATELSRYLLIPSERIHQIPNPVDVKFIEDQLKQATSPFAGDTINIVAAGTVCPRKGFDILLDAFAIVLKQDERFYLHILGKDNDGYRAKLEQQADVLGISHRIAYHGFQQNPYQYYKFCDLFVLSSRHEGLPNVLLECLYLGKPVVATRCLPVIERLVHDGKNGFKVDVENPEQMAYAILGYKKLQGNNVIDNNNGIVQLLERMVVGKNE